jgi:hypothetical protein
MKKTSKVPAKTARKSVTAKPVTKPATKKAKPASAPKPAPAAKVGWSETIRTALKEKQTGHGPDGGNVWSGKQRAGSKDPQSLRRGRTD